MWKAWRTYQPGRGHGWHGWVRRCATGEVLNAVTNARRVKRWPGERPASINEPAVMDDLEWSRRHDDPGPSAVVEWLNSATDRRGPRGTTTPSRIEAQVIAAAALGIPQRELATITGESPKRLDNARQRGTRKSRDHLEAVA